MSAGTQIKSILEERDRVVDVNVEVGSINLATNELCSSLIEQCRAAALFNLAINRAKITGAFKMRLLH
jgi:hypothetical protein